MYRRKWLTFRLSTLFLAVTVEAIGFAVPRIYRQIQFQRFKSFAEKEIRTLPEAEQQRFAKIVKPICSNGKTSFFPIRENWWVSRIQTDRGTRFVLFQGTHIWSIPGTSEAHVHLFDNVGRVVGQSSFSTGWRIDIVDAAVDRSRFGGEPLIVVTTTPTINGADIAKQYYAIIQDNVVLIRLEDSAGVSIPNDYWAPNHTIGPETITRTEAEWVRALSSPRATEILRTLLWLGGDHGQPIRNPGNVHIEDYEKASLHLNVCERADTQSALATLATNSDPWISKAAQLALQKLDAQE